MDFIKKNSYNIYKPNTPSILIIKTRHELLQKFDS